MLKRIVSIFVSLSAGLLASVIVLALAQHPAGTAWAAPEFKPLATTFTVGGGCASIQACIDAASPGDEVHIPAGLYTESVTVAKAISITGDLSSTTTIHAPDLQRVMTVTGTSVYLADMTLTGGVVSPTDNFDYQSLGGGGLLAYQAQVTLTNIALLSNTAGFGGGLFALTSTVTLDGVDISENTGSEGGGVAALNSSLLLNGGNIHGNNAGDGGGLLAESIGDGSSQTSLAGGQIYSNTAAAGGGVLINFGQMTLGGAQILSNTANSGGGVEIDGLGSIVTQTAGLVAGNSATTQGGGVFSGLSTFRLLGGRIVSNTAANGGGVASISSLELLLAGGEVASNSATGAGGGVYVNGSSAFSQTAGSIHHNVAQQQAGGLFLAAAPGWLSGGDISSNSAQNGGGLYTAGPLTITGGAFVSNTATSQGGGLYVLTGSITVENSQFISNSASAGSGGGIENLGILQVTDSAFISNTTFSQGGGIDNGGQMTVTNSSFVGNISALEGGGLGSDTAAQVISSTFSANQSWEGGGLSAMTGGQAPGVVITGSIFSDNVAKNGGGVHSTGIITLTQSTFTGNQATICGGALEVWPQASISNSLIISNTAPDGGGICDTGSVQLTNSTLMSNTATNHGGGVIVKMLLSAVSDTLVGNSAGVDGGAIYNRGGLTISATTMTGNTAANNGGALYVYTDRVATVDNTQFVSNTAFVGGGIYSNGLFQIKNSALISNMATNYGSALFVYSGTQALVDGSQFVGNQAAQNFPIGAIDSQGSLTVTNSVFYNTLGYALVNDRGLLTLASSVISNSSSIGLLNRSGIAVITGTTITENPLGGVGNGAGGGVASMIVTNSVFSSNSNPFADYGGALSNFGSLAITGTTFISNSSTAAGSAIYSYNGKGIRISHSTFTHNTNTAIYNSGNGLPTSAVFITDSVFSDNTNGGAIFNEADLLTVVSTTFSANSGNRAAAIYTPAADGLIIRSSAFYSNTSTSDAGAIQSIGVPLTMTNSTFSGNQASDSGGAIVLINGSSTLNNVTVVSNTAAHSHTGPGGGGLVISGTAVVTATNTLLAGNIDLGSLAPDCAGTLTTGGHNLIQSTTGCTLSGTASGDITGTAALLGPVQDNGGPTWTMALLPGSPAIDAGSPLAPGSGGGACEAADQRGVARPQGLGCDIGAFEAVGLSATITVQLSSSNYSALQSAGTVPITVTLSQGVGVTVTAQYTTSDGTALAGQDYLAASGAITFTPGLTETTFAVALLPSTPGAPDKSFGVAILSPTLAILGTPATATITIHNDAPLPTVAFSSSQFSVTESGGTATITATLSTASAMTATVQYATSDGTALAGSDYTTATGALTFTPGLTQTTFTIPITSDTLHEADETFGVALSSPTGASLGAPVTATVTIIDDDPAPLVRLNSAVYSVAENGGAAVITVTLSAASGLTATVQYATSNGAAMAGSDYTAASGVLTFTPGLTQTTFTVPITSDALHENNETFGVALSSPTGASLGTPITATVTIVDDDPAPLVRFSSATYTVTESAGTAAITVTLSAASGLTATVHYATSNGSATAGSDYTPVSGTLTFTPGLTQTTFSVPITSDTLHEADETFGVALSGPSGASLGTPVTATVTILDDDPAPLVRFSSAAYTVTESAGTAAITVTISAASGVTATVHYATSNGNATAGSDYTPVSGTLTFAPGQVAQVFTVPITNDVLVEASETVLLALSGPTGASLASPSSATLTILDDDIEYRVYLPLIARP